MTKRKIFIGSVCVMLMLGLFLMFGGRFLVYKKATPATGRAVIVPLMGAMPDRALEAAQLYKEIPGAEVIFVAPADPDKYFMDSLGVPGISAAGKFRNVLMKMGVPPDKVHYLRGPGNSTRREADLIARYVRAEGNIGQVIVVTSSYHSRRARWIFVDRFENAGVSATINVSPSRYTNFNPSRWYLNKDDAVMVMMEWEKLTYYLIVGQFQ